MTTHFIASDDDFDGAPILYGALTLDPDHGDVCRATLRLTALGVVEAQLNGQPVGDEVLAPGWSSYEWRLRYRDHDVIDLLVTSVNRLELALGNGWWRGRLGFTGQRAIYGEELAGWAELELEYADGHRQVIGTDETWRAGPSRTTANDLYDGQTIDAGRDTTPRAGVHSVRYTGGLVAAQSPPIRRHESVVPQRIWTSPSGATLLDFGQNLVGWLRATVRGPAGSVVTVRHAEVLAEGELATRPLRTAQATDRFVLSGDRDVFEPTFTTHGFRYAEITGWPGELVPGDIEAVVVHSAMEQLGTFRCSDSRLNRLHDNVAWTVRGNAVGVPTDCPQRDERLGWTGDIAVAAPAAAYLFDVRAFLADWLRDVALEQEHAEGRPPLFAPDCLKRTPPPEGLPPIDVAAIWGDATVWVPWALWTAYGDDAVLREQWRSMMAYADRAWGLRSERGLWEGGFQFGDWLDPQAPPDRPFESRADDGVVATACLFRSLSLMADIGTVIGQDGPWAERASELQKAFHRHYVEADGRILSDAPTVYALAIAFGLVDDPAYGDRLAELVRADGHRIGTGFAGTPFVLDALTSMGHLDDAYALLLQTECPSWLYMVGMGATTIWERWDSLLPDGSVNPGEMTSFNHYALGAVADWMHRAIGGITPLEPGYGRVLVDPRPGGGITWAESTLRTPYGEVRVRWQSDGGELIELDVSAPDGVEVVSPWSSGRRSSRE